MEWTSLFDKKMPGTVVQVCNSKVDQQVSGEKPVELDEGKKCDLMKKLARL